MSRHIMIDIETLSTCSNAVILSIGAVEFDATTLGKKFHTTIDIDSCLKHGLSIEGRTVAWWMDQSDNARNVFRTPGYTLPDVLQAFSFTSEMPWSNAQVWANGTDFDIAILANAYKKCGMKVPWAYNAVRDYRTMRKEFPIVKTEPIVAHNALDDAIAQAKTLQAIWASLSDVADKVAA